MHVAIEANRMYGIKLIRINNRKSQANNDSGHSIFRIELHSTCKILRETVRVAYMFGRLQNGLEFSNLSGIS